MGIFQARVLSACALQGNEGNLPSMSPKRTGRKERGVSRETEAEQLGTSPGPSQETQPTGAAGEVRAATLEKAGRSSLGKTNPL